MGTSACRTCMQSSRFGQQYCAFVWDTRSILSSLPASNWPSVAAADGLQLHTCKAALSWALPSMNGGGNFAVVLYDGEIASSYSTNFVRHNQVPGIQHTEAGLLPPSLGLHSLQKLLMRYIICICDAHPKDIYMHPRYPMCTHNTQVVNVPGIEQTATGRSLSFHAALQICNTCLSSFDQTLTMIDQHVHDLMQLQRKHEGPYLQACFSDTRVCMTSTSCN